MININLVFLINQTHPNVDKKLFNSNSIIGLKAGGKGFPVNNEIGVVKWRLQTKDEDMIPLTSMYFKSVYNVEYGIISYGVKSIPLIMAVCLLKILTKARMFSFFAC